MYRNEQVGFGPYLVLETLPWLLLATVIRLYSLSWPGGLSLLGFFVAHVPVFIAFLLASQKMVRLTGGFTALERLSFHRQLSLSWAVLWRLLLLFFCTIIIAVLLGMNKYSASKFWLGFDGIVFVWGRGFLPFWSALIAAIVFIMVVEKGLDRKPTFLSVVRQFKARWKQLTKAIIIIGLLFVACTFVQFFVGRLVWAVGEPLALPFGRNLLYIGFLASVSYVRLWLAITILTYAVRASYRQQLPQSAMKT
ncbi:hypothetical protein C7476_12249 [Phyllobacterium bourgognense]|uniref:Uncharacterized protein n=1 Tax=Phyllobacterium bourgognense TaxID=314236 RepID=A0A368YIM1_9HYPH|nr:hypothetical protein C7476_12249 [Phyllobacterium bourgognense]